MTQEVKDYRYFLRAKGLEPIVIHRTQKDVGDVVVHPTRKVEVVKWVGR